jgi:hypothetical protein
MSIQIVFSEELSSRYDAQLRVLFCKPLGRRTWTDFLRLNDRTSPSIYLIFQTIVATNPCGQLGPTYTNKVFPMDPADVSTLQPFPSSNAHTRMGPPQVLDVNDLGTDCGNFQAATMAPMSLKNIPGDINRCNPRIEWPSEVGDLGGYEP